MLIETDNKEYLLDFLLNLPTNIDKKVLPYLEGKLLDITYNEQLAAGDLDSLFEDDQSNRLNQIEVTKLEPGYNFTSFSESKQDQIFWIESLDTSQKVQLKKLSIKPISISKISKKLEPRITQELGLKTKLTDYTSYYELISESYIKELTDGFSYEQAIQTPLFFLGVKNLDKFYKSAIDSEFQLILSLIFSKAIKSSDQKLAKTITETDYMVKSGKTAMSNKNILGYNLFKYQKTLC